MNHTLALGLELMLYGLGGVFATLLIFIAAIAALTKFFPKKDGEQD